MLVKSNWQKASWTTPHIVPINLTGRLSFRSFFFVCDFYVRIVHSTNHCLIENMMKRDQTHRLHTKKQWLFFQNTQPTCIHYRIWFGLQHDTACQFASTWRFNASNVNMLHVNSKLDIQSFLCDVVIVTTHVFFDWFYQLSKLPNKFHTKLSFFNMEILLEETSIYFSEPKLNNSAVFF